MTAAGGVEAPGDRQGEATAPLKAAAAILTGLARGADQRGDRRLRTIYATALGELAALHVERLRDRLP